MSGISIALGISHTPWIPERVESMARLREGLVIKAGIVASEHGTGSGPLLSFRLFDEKCPVYVWSDDMWRWGESTEATHCLYLQDDVIPSPNFWPSLLAVLTALPDQVIALEAVHPAGQALAMAGVRGYTTADGLIGVGYVKPRLVERDFLNWKTWNLRDGAVEAITEDALINCYALDTGRRIYHPCPTLIRHDVELASTYGNDDHSYRHPSVIWDDGEAVGETGWTLSDLARADFWGEGAVPHLGRFYGGTYWLCKRWVKSWTPEKHRKAELDVCPSMLGRWL